MDSMRPNIKVEYRPMTKKEKEGKGLIDLLSLPQIKTSSLILLT